MRHSFVLSFFLAFLPNLAFADSFEITIPGQAVTVLEMEQPLFGFDTVVLDPSNQNYIVGKRISRTSENLVLGDARITEVMLSENSAHFGVPDSDGSLKFVSLGAGDDGTFALESDEGKQSMKTHTVLLVSAFEPGTEVPRDPVSQVEHTGPIVAFQTGPMGDGTMPQSGDIFLLDPRAATLVPDGSRRLSLLSGRYRYRGADPVPTVSDLKELRNVIYFRRPEGNLVFIEPESENPSLKIVANLRQSNGRLTENRESSFEGTLLRLPKIGSDANCSELLAKFLGNK